MENICLSSPNSLTRPTWAVVGKGHVNVQRIEDGISGGERVGFGKIAGVMCKDWDLKGKTRPSCTGSDQHWRQLFQRQALCMKPARSSHSVHHTPRETYGISCTVPRWHAHSSFAMRGPQTCSLRPLYQMALVPAETALCNILISHPSLPVLPPDILNGKMPMHHQRCQILQNRPQGQIRLLPW